MCNAHQRYVRPKCKTCIHIKRESTIRSLFARDHHFSLLSFISHNPALSYQKVTNVGPKGFQSMEGTYKWSPAKYFQVTTQQLDR